MPINTRQFTFVERAPFLRIGETAEMKMGIVNDTDKLIVISQMQEGKLFVDGEHIEYDFPRGATLTVTAGDNDLLAYIDPDCHAPYIAESQMKSSIV